ncbi:MULTISPECIES: dienelactone hydrolase family protein [unclassified Nocardioides]|uniref:dienelactone hydrolase family protein n=1 Tax=unclassified Nocardioides TaxID=2615069 RepID=UPI0006F40317|nr:MULTISPECIES: dienelactone hydrolase family protein [unclassified Nocardioides]KQY51598.1 dienelactone hydrolase [Nocardioides sp. Root140]KRF11000.1 dienelactone hydrolase [Nocardioides sp. Soil796]
MGERISCAMQGETAEAYATGDHGPGVLLYMDAIGLRPQIERMADRIASWGYVVLAPHVFWRDGLAVDLAPAGDLTAPGSREAFFATGVMDRVRSLTPELIRADADVWIETLRSRPGVAEGPIAATGYCFGGRLALVTAAHRPDDVAVVGMFHTGGIVTDAPDSPHLLVPDIAARVVAGHADGDASNTPEQIAAFDQALRAHGVRHQTAVYPGAAHGYTMADTSMYQEAGAERHFAELKKALDGTLAR